MSRISAMTARTRATAPTRIEKGIVTISSHQIVAISGRNPMSKIASEGARAMKATTNAMIPRMGMRRAVGAGGDAGETDAVTSAV